MFRTRHHAPTELVALVADASTAIGCARCGAPGDDSALADLADRTATDIATRYGLTT